LFRLPSDVVDLIRRGGTLVVPSHQRAHAVRMARAAAELGSGARVWMSPDVLAAAAWVRRECERRAQGAPHEYPRILSATEEWWLWRETAQQAAGEAPFLSTDALAESLQRATARAADWGMKPARGAPDSETTLLFEAQRLFATRCRELGATSVSALMGGLEARPEQPLLLRGFDAMPRGLARLAGERAAEPHSPALRAAAPVRAIRARDGESQLEAIAAWCRARLLERGDARLLVMLPGPAATRERLACLIRGCLDPAAVLADSEAARTLVGIEGGEPLASLALPAQALLGLKVLAGARVEAESLIRWLTSPYWRAPPAAARAALALLLRQRGMVELDLRELLGALQLAPRHLRPVALELEALIRRAAGRLGEGSASARRWSERFEAALGALNWPGPLPGDSAVQQTRLRWRELLEEFGGLAASAGSLGRAAALEQLQALAQRTAYRPADEDVPVTVSPMLADPVVAYDGIWVGSLSADVLPMPVAPDPFLPLSAQLAAGLPQASAAGRRAQAHSLIRAWAGAAPELVLSVPALDEDLELLPSPCLSDLAPELEEPTHRSLWLPLRLHRDGCTEGRDDAHGAPFTAPAPLPSGTRSLTLQNDCAFRAYAELRLGAAAPERAEPGVPMDQRGLLLHAALQLLWERLRGSETLAALDAPALEGLIGDCVARAAQALQTELRGRRRRARPIPDGQFDLFSVLSPALTRECARARVLIGRLCELERTRVPFTVAATEHTTELSLGGGRLRMRLDRVDAIGGGRIVLDYKSGRAGSADWFGERPTHPQLLAYLTALGSDVVALATVHLTAREVRFTGVAATADLLPRVKALPPVTGAAAADWAVQQSNWRALIERLIRAFLAGEAAVDPAPGACDYCHLTDLCRIGAHLAPEHVGHVDEADE
jgi:ATP-dependent helicase/nuclease subunit B